MAIEDSAVTVPNFGQSPQNQVFPSAGELSCWAIETPQLPRPLLRRIPRVRVFRPVPSDHPISLKILEIIRKRPRKTSGEIAALYGLSRRQVSRSLHSLLRSSHIYRSPAKRYTVTPKAAPVVDGRFMPLFDRRKALKALAQKKVSDKTLLSKVKIDR
jgi:hypothetical protein